MIWIADWTDRQNARSRLKRLRLFLKALPVVVQNVFVARRWGAAR